MRDIDVGDVLSRVFSIYGGQFLLLFGLGLVVNLVSALALLLIGSTTSGALLVGVIGFVVGFLYTGMVVRLVQDLEDGRRDSSVGALLSSVTPVLGPLIGVSVLAAIGIAIGFVLLLVPGLVLMTLWAVIAPVVVVERPGVLAAFSRSRELVRGNGWAVFGCLIVAFLIGFLATLVIRAIAGTGDGVYAVNWIVGAATAPISALVSAVLYFRLREEPAAGARAWEPPAGSRLP